MNIIFMRHGEATDNIREILSDKEKTSLAKQYLKEYIFQY